MKIIFYSVKPFEIDFINNANKNNYELSMYADRLTTQTADLSRGHDAVCVFSNDDVSEPVLVELKNRGIDFINIRASGYDNIDIDASVRLGITITNVADYSPEAIAEHAIMLMLCLLKKYKSTQKQIEEQNFTLDKIVGSNLKGKTVGVIGTGKIGSAMTRMLNGFEVKKLGFDIKEDKKLTSEYSLKYTSIETLCIQSDIITIHLPLNRETRHLIDEKLIKLMKYQAIIINTSRGAIINTADLTRYLKNKHVGGFGMDVYEHENGIFFYDHTKNKINDKILLSLNSMENVIITPHQAFATNEALQKISETTFHNFYCKEKHSKSGNEIVSVKRKELSKFITA